MRDQSIGFLAHVVAHQQPAGAAGKSGHVCVPSLQHQVEAGAPNLHNFPHTAKLLFCISYIGNLEARVGIGTSPADENA
jgi:hypothetical protein